MHENDSEKFEILISKLHAGSHGHARDVAHLTISPLAASTLPKAPFTRYNLLSNRLSNPFDNRFDNRLDVCLHDTAGCQTGCTTGLTTGCIV